MTVTFPALYQMEINTPLGLYRSKPTKLQCQEEYKELESLIIQLHRASFFNFENEAHGTTVIPGHVIQQSVIELIHVSEPRTP